MAYTSLADSFIARGASSVVGWNDLVESNINDKGVLDVLEKILVDGMKTEEAVESVMLNFKDVDNSNLRMKYYSMGAELEI